jgi:hypothetical protein
MRPGTRTRDRVSRVAGKCGEGATVLSNGKGPRRQVSIRTFGTTLLRRDRYRNRDHWDDEAALCIPLLDAIGSDKELPPCQGKAEIDGVTLKATTIGFCLRRS